MFHMALHFVKHFLSFLARATIAKRQAIADKIIFFKHEFCFAKFKLNVPHFPEFHKT